MGSHQLYAVIFRELNTRAMADGFDPCECIFNHEMAMRRLLSLLRSSQSYCTDNECLQDGLPGPGEGQASDPSSFMMMTVAWMVMAVIKYLMRPQSMRNNAEKPQGPPGGGRQDPDPPAVS